MKRTGGYVAMLVVLLSGGCATTFRQTGEAGRPPLRPRALDCLKAASRYDHNPVVRVAAVEAFESSGCDEARPWIRLALLDQEPAVRFAACAAVAQLADKSAGGVVHDLADDEDGSVRVAALVALHRLGDTRRTNRLPPYLLDHEDVTVRRNAAMMLGRMGEPGAIKILARAMRDPDPGVRHHALEALARLGNPEARQELTFMANTGVGSEEVFAINALAATGDSLYRDTFLYKLGTATHLETRLAAAHGLGLLGWDEGFQVALRALRPRRPRIWDPNDPPEDQILRVRLLAIGALGAIGRTDALAELERLLPKPWNTERGRDPRIQLAAARAILEILKANRESVLPSATRQTRHRR